MPRPLASPFRMSARRALTLSLGAASLTLIGCGGAQKARSSYLEDYNAGRYSVAQAMAAQEASRTTGAERERAALVAGLAAHANEQQREAERWLTPLTTSNDPEIAGRACAVMGLIEMTRSNNAKAAQFFRTAATRLKGDESAKASLFAGEAYSAMGKPDEARKEYAIAQATAQDAALKQRIRDRTTEVRSGAYAVQIGAFSDLANAQRAANDASATATRYNLGEPRVVGRSGPNGTMLYVVQVGRFQSRIEADAARLNMGGAAIVASAASGYGS